MDVQEYVRGVVSPLLKFPEQLKIEMSTDEKGVFLVLTVDREDMGSVIGREGINANAIRAMARQFGYVHGARVGLKIAEPEGGRHPANSTYDPDRRPSRTDKEEFGIY